ncbi:hypothetical protein F320042A7_05020 [Blautia producta]
MITEGKNIGITETLEERIGIDRTVIAGFRIVYINVAKFLAHDNVELERQGKLLYMLKDGSGFRWLKIKDNYCFGTLVAGTRNTKFMKTDFSRMDVFIQNVGEGNLQNDTVSGYKARLEKILQYVYDEYGILIDSSNIRLNEMEINCTFRLKDEFYKYHRVLRLMMFNLPKNFKKLVEYGRTDEKNVCIKNETFLRGNESVALKIYDKKEQLYQKLGFETQTDIMRIEIVLKKPGKIKEVFGSNLLDLISDKKINDYYIQQFVKIIENKYRKWQKYNGNYLLEQIIYHKKQNSRYWKSNLLRECGNMEQINQIPVLLDISDLLIVVKKIDKNGHFSRDKKELLRQCKHNNVFQQKDADKAEELISKVHSAYKMYTEDITPGIQMDMTIDGEVLKAV